jgi:prevent-host-death family protein
MKKARIAELKNNLSRYLEHVRSGGSVLVLDRDRPVAQLAPLSRVASTTGEVRERLKRLEHRGLIRRGTGGRPEWLGRHRPVRLRGSVLRDLLKERETGW